MHRKSLVLLIVGCLAWAACSSASPPPRDLIVKRKVTTAGGGAATDSTCYWTAHQRVTDDAQRRIIFDRDAKRVTVLDKSHNAYFVLPFDQILKQRQTQNDPAGWTEWNGVIANVESSGYAGRQVAEPIAKRKGYPMRSSLNVNMGGKQAAFTAEVTDLSFAQIPADVLALPAGAIKAEAPALK